MTISTPRRVLVVATVTTVAALAWLWLSATGSVLPRDEQPETADTVAVLRASASPAKAEAPRAPVGAPSILVIDEAGQPLPDVGVWRASADRWLRRDSDSYVGATTLRGQLEVAHEPVGAALVVSRHGFLAEGIALSGASEQRVCLRRGGMVEFRCIDQDDQPLPGVLVRASRAGMDINEDWPLLADTMAQGGPGADPANAQQLAVSDATGLARLHGLSGGEVAWEACAEGYMIADGPGMRPPDNERVTCPGRQYTLAFAPMYAEAFVVKGDRISHYQGKPNHNWVYSPLGAYQTARVTKRLRSQHPEWRLSVMAIRDRTKPLTMVHDLVLERTGPLRISVPYRPLAELLRHGPEIVDVTSKPASADIHARDVTVRLLNADGHELPGCSITLADKQRDKLLILRSGERRSVPVGTYRMTAAEATVERSLPLPRTLQVDAAADIIDIRLTRELRRVRVTKSAAAGAEVPPLGMVVFDLASGLKTHALFGKENHVDVCLPLGRVTAELQCHGHAASRAEFVVVRGKDMEIDLAVGRR